MKRILITGAKGYIGANLEKWLSNYPEEYSVATISLRDDTWKMKNFSEYDVICHTAGIVHKKETMENELLYYEINRDLTYNLAKKAKEDGVKQFIFYSTMSIYGLETGTINDFSDLKPVTNYGKSKLQAEELIQPLNDTSFHVAILRPPMIYGKGCKGNYPRLAKLTVTIPVFPEIHNKRSMIYIDNLSEFVKQLIDYDESGLFFPQNDEYVDTCDMACLIAAAHGRKIRLVKVFNPFVKKLKISIMNKVFGTLIYDRQLSEYKNSYNVCSFEDSILLSEAEDKN